MTWYDSYVAIRLDGIGETDSCADLFEEAISIYSNEGESLYREWAWAYAMWESQGGRIGTHLFSACVAEPGGEQRVVLQIGLMAMSSRLSGHSNSILHYVPSSEE